MTEPPPLPPEVMDFLMKQMSDAALNVLIANPATNPDTTAPPETPETRQPLVIDEEKKP